MNGATIETTCDNPESVAESKRSLSKASPALALRSLIASPSSGFEVSTCLMSLFMSLGAKNWQTKRSADKGHRMWRLWQQGRSRKLSSWRGSKLLASGKSRTLSLFLRRHLEGILVPRSQHAAAKPTKLLASLLSPLACHEKAIEKFTL